MLSVRRPTLGSGKTTVIGRLARWLEARGRRVALVTNDQGLGLLDTVSARSALSEIRKPGGDLRGRVEEITGGCFCCRLEELVGAIGRLRRESRPDVIVAEPVGSCTDVMATVLLPLEKVYKTPMRLSPLSVVLDARRALAVLGGGRRAGGFHRNVGYIFRKQMEEAEWLVVNKIDLLDDGEIELLSRRLDQAYPGRRVFAVSGKTGEGLEGWFEALLDARSSPDGVMSVDYDRYAEGEALLGWVNSEARCELVDHSALFRWEKWVVSVGGRIAALLEESGSAVGHFKMSVEAGGRRWRLNQTMSGEAPVLIDEPAGDRDGAAARVLVNLRAEGDAEDLEALVGRGLASQSDVAVEFVSRAAFQPGRPQPVHRMAGV